MLTAARTLYIARAQVFCTSTLVLLLLQVYSVLAALQRKRGSFSAFTDSYDTIGARMGKSMTKKASAGGGRVWSWPHAACGREVIS